MTDTKDVFELAHHILRKKGYIVCKAMNIAGKIGCILGIPIKTIKQGEKDAEF